MSRKTSLKVVVLLGPTSSGKSDLAIRIAQRYDGEIISADSRQIYRHMDLGTGKVEGRWENGAYISDGIVHHLIDFVQPNEEYNITHFQRDCYRLIGDIHSKGKLPIICGGTGFWISSAVDNVKLPEVKPDPELRQELSEKSAEELWNILHSLDPGRAGTIDRQNKVRLIRAIEIAKVLGKVPPLASGDAKSPLEKILQYIVYKGKKFPVIRQKISCNNIFPTAEKNAGKIDIEFLQIGIDHPREILDQRIKQRIDQRLSRGMVEEVSELNQQYGLGWKKIQSFGLGYYWIPLYLRSKITEAEMHEKIYLAERNYAKRQRTWFKRDKRIVWIQHPDKADALVQDFLSSAITLRSFFFC